MLFVLIFTISIFAVVLGRVMMGRWLNHLSLYSAGFGLSLSAYATGLIEYHPISTESWLMIVAGTAAFYLGSAAVLFSWKSEARPTTLCVDVKKLRYMIYALSACGALAVLAQVGQVAHEFGSLSEAILTSAVKVYGLRMKGELGGEPYLLFMNYAACALSGGYVALRGRVTTPGVLPLLLILASVVLSMQRAALVITGLTFLFAYMFAPRRQSVTLTAGVKWITGVAGLVILATLILIGGHRGMYKAFPGQTPALTEIGKHWADFPAHFIYISSPGPTLTQYLEHPELAPKGLFASYTLQSVYRLLSKVGFETNVPYYPPFVHSPVEANQGTYLAYIYSDFGGGGVVLVPFLVGAVVTVLARRIDRSPRFAEVMLYSHLMLCVTFAFTWYIVSATFFLASMVVSVAVGMYLDRLQRKSDVESVEIALA
jgi:hypothetical protein